MTKKQLPLFNIYSRILDLNRRTDGQTDMAISTPLFMLIKNIYSLLGLRFFLKKLQTFDKLIYTLLNYGMEGIKTTSFEKNQQCLKKKRKFFKKSEIFEKIENCFGHI